MLPIFVAAVSLSLSLSLLSSCLALSVFPSFRLSSPQETNLRFFFVGKSPVLLVLVFVFWCDLRKRQKFFSCVCNNFACCRVQQVFLCSGATTFPLVACSSVLSCRVQQVFLLISEQVFLLWRVTRNFFSCYQNRFSSN